MVKIKMPDIKTNGKKKLENPIVEIAGRIMSNHTFKTPMDTGEIYFYNDGIYHPNGEALINEECKRIEPEITKHNANEVAFHIQANTYARRKDITMPPHLIHLENGIFDLENGKLLEFSPKYFGLVQLPVKYDPNADCPKIKKFLSEILHESDIPTIQELFGFCLLRDYHIQKAFMFLGEGNNGKSTLLLLFRGFLGRENVSSVALQTFEANRFAVGNLHGKLANMYADISDKALQQTGIFKMLTGGDMIFAEKKFKDGFSFVNHAKLIFSANKLPEAHDDTTAFFRRWIIINFPNSFDGDEADKKILDKLCTPKEISGLLNFALAGLGRLVEKGCFSFTVGTEIVREDYERKSNSFLAFLKDCLEFDPEYETTKEEFYKNYVKYCKSYKLPTKDKASVSKEIARNCPSVSSSHPRIDGKKVHAWRGVKVEQVEQLEQPKTLSKLRGKQHKIGEEKESKVKVKKNPVPPVPVVPLSMKLKNWRETGDSSEAKRLEFLRNIYDFDEDELEKLKTEGVVFCPVPGKYQIVR